MKTEEKMRFKDRLEWTVDDITLRICRPFEEKARDIRYKRSDPEGYEADKIVLASSAIIKHLEKKKEKGKKFSKKEIDLLMKLNIAFRTIEMRKLGKNWEMASQALSSLSDLVTYCNGGDEIPEEVKQKVNEVLAVFANALSPVEANPA